MSCHKFMKSLGISHNHSTFWNSVLFTMHMSSRNTSKIIPCHIIKIFPPNIFANTVIPYAIMLAYKFYKLIKSMEPWIWSCKSQKKNAAVLHMRSLSSSQTLTGTYDKQKEREKLTLSHHQLTINNLY